MARRRCALSIMINHKHFEVRESNQIKIACATGTLAALCMSMSGAFALPGVPPVVAEVILSAQEAHALDELKPNTTSRRRRLHSTRVILSRRTLHIF